MGETTRIENKLKLTPGSGIPRILQAYGEESFKFSENFIRIIFPVSVQVDDQDGTKSALSRHQVGTESALREIDNIENLIIYCSEIRSVVDMLTFMGLSDRTKFRNKYINPLLKAGILEMTIPDKPNSQNQKYRLTPKGLQLQEALRKQNENNKHK